MWWEACKKHASTFTPSQDIKFPEREDYPLSQTNSGAIDVLPKRKKMVPRQGDPQTLENLLDPQHGDTESENNRPNTYFDKTMIKNGPQLADWSAIHTPNEMNPSDRTLM